METYNRLPVIFTKDPSFAQSIEGQPLGPGAVVVLPHDAILVFEPEIITQSVTQPINLDLAALPPVEQQEEAWRAESDMWPEQPAPKKATKIPVEFKD